MLQISLCSWPQSQASFASAAHLSLSVSTNQAVTLLQICKKDAQFFDLHVLLYLHKKALETLHCARVSEALYNRVRVMLQSSR